MPPVVNAQDIISDARNVYLNDQTGRFTNAILLPYVKMAVGYMETNLEENNVACKSTTLAAINVPVGALELIPLPADFVWPISLKERNAGSTDLYADMIERAWEPQIAQGDRLVYWAWREDRIKFVGALTNREVLLNYVKSFPIVNVATDVVYNYARQYLAAKVAALVHEFISQNETLAERCNTQAETNIEQIINIQVKKQQATPVRRKPYVPFR